MLVIKKVYALLLKFKSTLWGGLPILKVTSKSFCNKFSGYDFGSFVEVLKGSFIYEDWNESLIKKD